MTLTASRIQNILSYADNGWKIIPLHNITDLGNCSCGDSSCSNSAAKHPRIKGWKEQATSDYFQIRNWWNLWPNSNVGIVTGNSSGLIVLDVDPRHGGDNSLQGLIQDYGGIPETPRVITGGGGQHFYFRTSLTTIRNKTNIRPGLDLRGEGGYIVAPPSLHKSKRHYEWEGQLSIEKIAELPEWLLEIVEAPKHLHETGDKILEGKRHDFLVRKGGSLRRAGLSGAPLYLALQSLNQEQCLPPLPENEVRNISSGVSRYPSDGSFSKPEKVFWKFAPKELPPAILPVPELSENLIPIPMRAWVMDIADRMQIAPEFVMVPAIIALSSVVGRKMCIYPKEHDDWCVIPNLWGGPVGRPGIGKTPAMSEALSPLDHLSELAAKDFEELSRSASSETHLINARIEAVKEDLRRAAKGGKSEDLSSFQAEIEELEGELETIRVKEKRYKTNDATVEKIARLLKDNPNGILVVRDELSGWLKTLDKAGREGDREFYLEAWNGFGTYTVDRVGSGTIHVPALCLSLLGGIQPGKLQAYVNDAKKGKGDDGLLQRFQLLVYPDQKKEWMNVDRVPDLPARSRVFEIFRNIDQLNADSLGAEIQESKDKIPGVRFSPKAQLLFNSWRSDLERKLRSDHLECPAFESHLAKYRSLMPSLALLFWLVDTIESGGKGSVSLSATEMAIGWCEFLEKHALKIYSPTAQPGLMGANVLAKKIRNRDLKDQETVRSVCRRQWAHLETSEKVEEALFVLEQLHWIQISHGSSNSRKIHINPKLQS